MLGEFLKQFSARDSLAFSGALEHAYSEVVSGLRRQIPSLDDQPYSLDDDSTASVAAQFYRLFPSHCLKCLDALARSESRTWHGTRTTAVLGWPTITLVDVGCGSGAGTAAVLELLQWHQQFVLRTGRPLRRVMVQAIGLDPSEAMLGLYEGLVGRYSDLLTDLKIDVTAQMLTEPFPEGIWQTTRMFQPENRHQVLMIMSNIVRVLTQSYDMGRTPWFERILRAVGGGPVASPQFGEAEASALRRLVEGWHLDRLGLLCIATAGKEEVSGTRWHVCLQNMDKAIQEGMTPHRVERTGVKEIRTRFENPRDCWWRACKGIPSYPLEYHFDFLEVVHDSYDKDVQWGSATSHGNLELAWARARRHALHEDMADEVEIMLFDRSADGKLDRLRKELLLQNWPALNAEHMLLYGAPKKRGTTRPRAVARLEDQIASAAAVQSFADNPAARRPASYSYRLSGEGDEFLYQYWLHLWKAFLTDSQKRAESRTVLRSDVRGFYEHIQQDLLMDAVRGLLGDGTRLDGLAGALLLRDCGPPHRSGRGLPQGHVASGFWADLYLAKADAAFSTLPGVTFARYADDMVFVVDGSESQTATVESELRKGLAGLRLEPSEDKTYPQSGGQYVSETTLDQLLRELDEDRFRTLVKQVYRVSGDYRRIYSVDPWGFVGHYSALLRLLPLFMSEPWLRRKIEQYAGWRDRLSGRRLRFPPFPGSHEGDDAWLGTFMSLNAEWNEQLTVLRGDLITLCIESIRELASHGQADSGATKALRRLRFAAYRLCAIGLDTAAEPLCEQIVDRPCSVPVHTLSHALADCGRADLLREVLDNSESEFVRACALRALAQVRPSPPDWAIARMWAAVTDTSSGTLHRLKASEGLLFADYWEEADISEWMRLVQETSDPYLLKNLVLIGARAFGDSVRECLARLCKACDHPVVLDAVEYALTSSGRRLMSEYEPDVLRRYYSTDYPVVESDTKEVESP